MLTLGIIANHGADSFRKLVDSAIPYVEEIVVAVDACGCEPGIMGYRPEDVVYFERALNMDFSAQRNAVCDRSTQQWILFLDTDENLGNWLWRNIKAYLSTSAEVIFLPRANYIEGKSKNEDDLIGWPDWQPKLHRKHIRWHLPVHEWPAGTFESYRFPENINYAIVHRKNIESCTKAHEFYQRIINQSRTS